MKAVLAAAFLFGLCGFTVAQATKVDPSGTWKCETDINRQKRASTLTVMRDGDKLTGTMTWPDNMESKIEGAVLKDAELTFSAAREREGQRFTIKYKVKVDGDTIKGKAEADLGGETRTFDFEGKREKK